MSKNIKTNKTRNRLPGDPNQKQEIARMIRVNHAGEYGAVRIYEGQLSILSRSASAPLLKHMAEQERHHIEVFD